VYNSFMKILYISGNQRSEQFPWLTDYQDDCLLLGLKELFGDDVVDSNKRFHLYSDYSDDQLATEYGRGFTNCRKITSLPIYTIEIRQPMLRHR
jgi:hypothetical protein